MKEKEWALCLSGTFSRLAPHTGALHACYEAFTQGLLIREPSYICTSSVAAIPASVAIQRSEELFKATEEMIINLRKRDFVSIHPDLKKKGAVDLVSMLALLLAAHETGKIKNSLARYSALLSLGFPAYQISKKTIKDIFTVPSFLVYDNLVQLLMRILDFERIFNSPIKIEIPAVNINKAGWTLDKILSDPPLYLNGWHNAGWVSVTNFKPEDVNLEKEVRNRRYVERLVNGLRVYAHVQPGRHDNDDAIVDTATLSNLPIHFAVSQGYSNIVVFYYNSTTEGPLERTFSSWVEALNRDIDVTVAEATRKMMLGYLRVNNDLQQLERQRESLKRLRHEILEAKCVLEGTPDIIERHIQEIEETIGNLSYAHKKRINFIFVGSDPLPEVHFSQFTQDEMIEGINIGWRAGWDTIPKINKMIE